MAAPQPVKNKFRTSGGGKEEDFVVTPPSFSFSMPPPMKKAKHCHNHRHCGGGSKISVNKNNSSINGGGGEEELLNNKKNGRQLMSSPTDVLAHPAAAAAINNGSRRQEAAFIRALPPSLRGINEAAKTLQLSSRCSKNNISNSASPRNTQQQTPQLVAFPTEALYVLTCCVKTTSQKKLLLRSNTNDSIIKSRNDSVSSSLIGSSSPGSCSFASGTVALGEGEDTPGCSNSSGVGDCGGSGDIDFSTDNRKKQAIHCDAVHPPNSSLDHLLSRNQEVSSREGAPSVFVLGNKHAQHYCEFSTPKMFAIRPKQRSGSSSSSQLLKKREKEEKEETCSPSSPIKSSQQSLSSSSSLTTDWPMTVPPSPKKSCTIPLSTSSSSLFIPVTPKTSAEGAAAHAVTPIAANNTVAVNTTTAKIHAVNFSESYEAFSRLANKFWPGPMIIYAPARMVGGSGGGVECKGKGSGSGSTDRKDLRSSPNLQQQQQRTWSRQSSSGSSASSSSSSEGCPSLPSFTNLQSLNTGGAAGAEGGAMESVSSKVSVLPPSVLIPERDLLPGRDYNDCGSNREKNRFFIGMQCPSHPLSRKLLTEVHRPRRASASSTSVSTIAHSPSTDSLASFSSSLDTSPIQQQQIRCGIAVVGSYIQPLTLAATSSSSSLSQDGRDDQEDKGNGHGGAILATSASNVKEILSASPNLSNTEQILVVNGEDSTREHWSVPTCNYVTHPISLVVDGDNRTIHLLHNNRHDGGGASASGSDHSKEMIYRALLQPSSSSKVTTASLNMENGSNKGASTTSRSEIDRVITAVLSRWKVVKG